MSTPLRERHARQGKVPKLAQAELDAGLKELPDWKLSGGTRIERQLKFKDFLELMRFVNRMAELAQAENHHPDFTVHYNVLDVTLWTHDAGGLTENDLIVAARIDALLAG